MPQMLPVLPLPFASDQTDCAAPATLAAPRHLHLIVPYAELHSANQASFAALNLPHLKRLMAQMQHMGRRRVIDIAETPLRTPTHERAAACAWGLDETAPAWAAHAADQSDCVPQAWFTPCHWRVGADQIHMSDPRALALTPQEIHALHALLAPWFADDGLTLEMPDLHSGAGLHWRVRGALLAGLETASLDAVIGRDVRHWQPRPKTGLTLLGDRADVGAEQALRQIQRLQSEVQMLLYNHSLNAEREAQRAPTINAFWLHGAGVLDRQSVEYSENSPHSTTPYVHVLDDLRQAALLQRWDDWARAWQRADAGVFAHWAAALEDYKHVGGQFSLWLCAAQRTLVWTTQNNSAPHPWWQRWLHRWGKEPVENLSEILRGL